MGETVPRAAVHDHLPVRARLVHLLGERPDIAERHVRVQRAVADEQPGADRAGLRSPAGAEAPVDTDRTCDWFTRSGEREDSQAAETEADSRDASVRARATRKGSQARLRPPDHERRVIPQRGEAADDTVPVACYAITEHVTGEDDISKRRVTAGLLAGVLIQAGASVDEQNARPDAGQRFVPAQYAGQRGVQVAVRPVPGRDMRAGTIGGHSPDITSAEVNQILTLPPKIQFRKHIRISIRSHSGTVCALSYGAARLSALLHQSKWWFTADAG